MKAISKTTKEEIMPKSKNLNVKLREDEKERYLERKRQRNTNAHNSNVRNSIITLNLHDQIDEGTQPIASDMTLLSQKPQYELSDSVMSDSLRTVFIPQNTVDVFLQLVQRNTTNNIETCGVLAGHLADNNLYITHIILPKQSGTGSTCDAMYEEEILNAQNKRNLITLGWIHTHPTQIAFLSSVDLHTQCSYQIMMPEAVAIVCAPKYRTTGIYMLTPTFGLHYIAKCRRSGFHAHKKYPRIYMAAKHTQMDPNKKINIVDLRFVVRIHRLTLQNLLPSQEDLTK